MKMYVVLLWLLLLNHGILGESTSNDETLIKMFTKSPLSNQGILDKLLFVIPETFGLQAVNAICIIYYESVKPNADLMVLKLFSPCEVLDFPLANSKEIARNPNFHVTKKVAIFVHGWKSSAKATYVYEMAEAFACKGDYNFLALDWTAFIYETYTPSANNTEEIGRLLALALVRLVELVPVQNIHLIGFSLGAHISGYTGRYFTEYTGLKIPRVTALDPANPCFSGVLGSYGLKSSDAEFVDVIHTNPGMLGKASPIGHVDFYAEGLTPIKPGCLVMGCSHGRSYEYFTESIFPGNENNFLANRCNSYYNLFEPCKGRTDPMGITTPRNTSGIYFFPVNSKKPFGKHQNNGKSKCRRQTTSCLGKFGELDIITTVAVELFNATTNVLFKLPENLNISVSWDEMCLAISVMPSFYSTFVPSLESLYLKLYTPYKTVSFSLGDASKIAMSPYFDGRRNRIAILINGWLKGTDYASEMAAAFNSRRDYNFLVFNICDSIDNLYIWNSFDTQLVGYTLALALIELVKHNPSLYIHLIGHSLGAHVAGYAGHHYTLATKLRIHRITGLDPAASCFSYGKALQGLQPGHAEFVDVIHTNPGVFGKADRLGDVDFFVEGLTSYKPGCIKFGCSHNRAYDYFIESIYPGNEHSFMASKCINLNKDSHMCDSTKVPMGLPASSNVRGIYFVSVNPEIPFGQNEDGPNEGRQFKAKIVPTYYGPWNVPLILGAVFNDVPKEFMLQLTDYLNDTGTIEDMCRAAENYTSYFYSKLTPSEESLYLTLLTPYNNVTFLLENTSKIPKSPYFDANNKVVILFTGGLYDQNYAYDMAEAFHCRGNYNFLVFNMSGSINKLRDWNNYDTQRMGFYFAIALIDLLKYNPKLNIHLIGHSIGAHIAGYAGQYYTLLTKKWIPRITGLDPAAICFGYGKTLSGLKRGQAQFVDVIHTNPGSLGRSNRLGDVDFYVEGFSYSQPGCKIFGCSHNRAYDYFIESVYPGLEYNFMAVNCKYLSKYSHVCNGRTDPMGLQVPHNAKGIYYLTVNADSPFGKNDSGWGECIC